MEADNLVSLFTGNMDYGLDLEWLQEEVAGNIDYGVRFKDNHTPPPKRSSGKKSEFAELVTAKEKKRVDELPIGFYGKVEHADAGTLGLPSSRDDRLQGRERPPRRQDV